RALAVSGDAHRVGGGECAIMRQRRGGRAVEGAGLESRAGGFGSSSRRRAIPVTTCTSEARAASPASLQPLVYPPAWIPMAHDWARVDERPPEQGHAWIAGV